MPTETAGGLLATARTVGLLLKNGIDHPWIAGARAFCRDGIDSLESTFPYETMSINVLLDNEPDRAWARSASTRLGEIVRDTNLVLLDPANPEGIETPPGFADEEFHYACDFAPRPDCLAAQWFSQKEMAVSLDHLASEQREDGGWPIYYVRWAPPIEHQARPGFTLRALKILRAWDRAA